MRRAVEGHPTVLVLTPVKQAAAHLPRYFEALSGCDYPPDRLSVGILEGDSTDGSYPSWLRSACRACGSDTVG